MASKHAAKGKRKVLLLLLAVIAVLAVLFASRFGGLGGVGREPYPSCVAGKHFDSRQNKCVCNEGTAWDPAQKKCIKPKALRTWNNVTINRYGSYKVYGQGQNWSGTVACTAAHPKGHPGIWTALNPAAMGFGTKIPCGARLRVTNPKNHKSQEVVVMDGGGSEGLDIDDTGYYNLVQRGQDGLQDGFIVEQLTPGRLV